MTDLILASALCVFGGGLLLSALALTTTMLPGKLGAYFASTAIIGWLEDTVMPLSCAGLLITSLCLAAVS